MGPAPASSIDDGGGGSLICTCRSPSVATGGLVPGIMWYCWSSCTEKVVFMSKLACSGIRRCRSYNKLLLYITGAAAAPGLDSTVTSISNSAAVTPSSLVGKVLLIRLSLPWTICWCSNPATDVARVVLRNITAKSTAAQVTLWRNTIKLQPALAMHLKQRCCCCSSSICCISCVCRRFVLAHYPEIPSADDHLDHKIKEQSRLELHMILRRRGRLRLQGARVHVVINYKLLQLSSSFVFCRSYMNFPPLLASTATSHDHQPYNTEAYQKDRPHLDTLYERSESLIKWKNSVIMRSPEIKPAPQNNEPINTMSSNNLVPSYLRQTDTLSTTIWWQKWHNKDLGKKI